jgi:hypothetical protein
LNMWCALTSTQCIMLQANAKLALLIHPMNGESHPLDYKQIGNTGNTIFSIRITIFWKMAHTPKFQWC